MITTLIGLAGTPAGGKDTLAERMVRDHGFTHVSTGDMVREVATQQRGSIERPILYEIANIYRHQHGAGVFVHKALKKPRPLVITGLRTTGEARVLKNADGLLVWIDAPGKIRYQRMKSRRRDNEAGLSFEEFTIHEQKEWHAGNGEADFNLRDIKEMSDIVFDKALPLEEFIANAYQKLGFT